MNRCSYVQGSLKHRRWMKKDRRIRQTAFDRDIAQFKRRQRGWHWVTDPEDGYSYAHHWMNFKPVIHKGRKP